MKRLLFLLILSPCFSFGQNFGIVGTEWHYSEHALGGCPGNCEYLHLKSIADTIITGKTTHKITQTYYTYYGDTVQIEPIYLYEQADTVFMYSFSKAKFLTIYIFNGDIGDTLTLDLPDTTFRLVIDTIINTIVDGVPLKKYRTTGLDGIQFYNGGYFMDRIGGLDWFFPRGTIIPEAGGPIRCYSDAQIDTNFQAVPCDHILYSSIPDRTSNIKFIIYPNPTTGIFTIQGATAEIQIFDLFGRLVLRTNKAQIDMSSYPAGLYIWRVGVARGKLVLN